MHTHHGGGGGTEVPVGTASGGNIARGAEDKVAKYLKLKKEFKAAHGRPRGGVKKDDTRNDYWDSKRIADAAAKHAGFGSRGTADRAVASLKSSDASISALVYAGDLKPGGAPKDVEKAVHTSDEARASETASDGSAKQVGDTQDPEANTPSSVDTPAKPKARANTKEPTASGKTATTPVIDRLGRERRVVKVANLKPNEVNCTVFSDSLDGEGLHQLRESMRHALAPDVPIIAWDDLTICDGERRWRVLVELGVKEVEVIVLPGKPDREAVEEAIVKYFSTQRNATYKERLNIFLMAKKTLAREGGVRRGRPKKGSRSENKSKARKREIGTKAASTAGFRSYSTAQKVQQIFKDGDDELKRRLNDGLSIGAAYGLLPKKDGTPRAQDSGLARTAKGNPIGDGGSNGKVVSTDSGDLAASHDPDPIAASMHKDTSALDTAQNKDGGGADNSGTPLDVASPDTKDAYAATESVVADQVLPSSDDGEPEDDGDYEVVESSYDNARARVLAEVPSLNGDELVGLVQDTIDSSSISCSASTGDAENVIVKLKNLLAAQLQELADHDPERAQTLTEEFIEELTVLGG
jgi:hypothetical protein